MYLSYAQQVLYQISKSNCYTHEPLSSITWPIYAYLIDQLLLFQTCISYKMSKIYVHRSLFHIRLVILIFIILTAGCLVAAKSISYIKREELRKMPRVIPDDHRIAKRSALAGIMFAHRN